MRSIQVFAIGFVISINSGHEVCQAQVPQPGLVVDSRLGGGFLITHSDDPTQDFSSARQSFLDLDATEAALRIRRGLQRMRETLADAIGDSRQAIQDSVIELESLARATELRSVNSVRRLDEAFARANYALAQRHYLSALRAREQMAQAHVGEEIRRSAEYLQRARQHVGLQLRDEEAAVIDRTRTLGSNLSAGLAVTSNEVAREIRNLGHSLTSLRDRIRVLTAANDEPIRR